MLDEGRRASLWLFGPALVWTLASALGLLATAVDERAWSAVERRRSTVAGSDACRSCHPDEHATWSRSYHRTMTQRAEGEAVLAPFAGETLEALGFVATMSRGDRGQPHLEVERLDPQPEEDPVLLDVDVALTVGSHRYQQYVAYIDRGGGEGELWRLPVAWHVELGRWIHINDAFLTPEGQWGEQEDYLRHLSRWNDNCIFCHNTEPVPGLTDSGRFESTVGEWGIACEACHGPASAHVERHAWPPRRLLALGERPADGSIAHPGRLHPARQADVCGRCHGNRIAADIAEVMRHGDGFLPGEPLSEVSRPILRDSTLAGQEGQPFAARFWADGTPRLSAYEYQALQMSPCYQDGEGLGCGDCHTMHGEEPSMQLRTDVDTTSVCLRCHEPAALSFAEDPGGHGWHGEAVSCAQCHLPRVTYGLLEGMMSHRITVPAPRHSSVIEEGPDACTHCHVDRSRYWAFDALETWVEARPPPEEDRDPDPLPRVLLALHGGDPIQRALAAHALARPEPPVDPRTRMAWLVDALEDDYPAIRWFGFRGLRALARRHEAPEVLRLLDAPGMMDDAGVRAMVIEGLRAELGGTPLDAMPAVRDALHRSRDERAIWIGE